MIHLVPQEAAQPCSLSPVPAMRLVEVVRGEHTSDDIAERARELAAELASDRSSTRAASTHANARDALQASLASGALPRLAKIYGE